VDVSVIIPCFNSEAFLEECIASVVAQQGVSFEIIAIDDGSTDGTPALLAALQTRVPHFRVETLARNGGQAKARNVGIELAVGRYIAFLDSDDFYAHDQVLAGWLAQADADGLDICIAQYKVLAEDGSLKPMPGVGGLGVPFSTAYQSPEIANIICSWQMLLNHAFVRQHELRFSNLLRQREDRVFFLQALFKADRIGVCPDVVINHRRHPGSTTKRVDYDQLAQYTTGMPLVRGILDDADAVGRLHPDFARVNALVYWRTVFEYWTPLVVEALGDGATEESGRAQPTEREIALRFLANLHDLTRDAPLLFPDTVFNKIGPFRERLAEGVYDVGRMAVAAKRYDILLALLNGERLHLSELTALIVQSGLPWAETAVCYYLRFLRSCAFPQERVTSATPPLNALIKRVVLHSGMPGTGSTAIQDTLENNRLRLLEQGIWYPVYGTMRERGVRRDHALGHVALIRRVLTGREDVSARLAAEIASLERPVDTLVLSVEAMLSHPIWRSGQPEHAGAPSPIMALVDALGVDHVEVVAVLQRQDRWFASYFREVMADPFNDVIAGPRSFVDLVRSTGLLDYQGMLRDLEAPDRVRKLHVESHQRVAQAGGSVRWFLNRVGIAADRFVEGVSAASNGTHTDAIAASVRLLKRLRLPRVATSRLFEAISRSEVLAQSGYALVSKEDWDHFDQVLARELADFDARFPDEKQPRDPRREDAERLPILPELMAAGAGQFI